ncbi:MAG: hypothetical protein JNL68_00915 [Burkholderiales bacterium]|nr:hypothetical protein [Burkholderiales bacterium]
MAHMPSKVSDVAVVIRRYLSDHPRASDSLEGVQRWWLAEGAVEAPGPTVQQALDQLVKKGTVVRKLMPDGTVVYAGAEAAPLSS